jgi:cytochrome c biogenesis protein CcdA
MLLYLVTALLLGMRHALDPDHLVAVSSMVAEERRLWPAARLGLIWGLGHMVPLALIGLPALLLGLRLPPAMEETVDLGVGLLLVALGVRTFLRLRRERVHFHEHAHGVHRHAHFHTHVHGRGHDHAHPSQVQGRGGLITLGIGMAHGLAGSGPAALLALTAAGSTWAGAGYLLAFGAGTCAGMFAATLCLAAPALAAASRFARLHDGLRALAGAASLALGAWMGWHIVAGWLA